VTESKSSQQTPKPDLVALRSRRDVEGLDRAASLAWLAARAGLEAAQPGRTTAEVGEVVCETVVASGGRPAFDGYLAAGSDTPFSGAASISVNEEAAHAQPGSRELAPGDVVTIDVGVELDGWCGDIAESAVLPGGKPGAEILLRACRRAVAAGVRACGPGERWSSVARAIRGVVAAEEFVVLPELSGHGVGRLLHEPPRAGYRIRSGDRDDLVLLPGMVLTIEPILAAAPGRVERKADGWTVRTADGSPACYVERMIAVTRSGSRILGLPGRCF
jgi:methionyl aminopeptidase